MRFGSVCSGIEAASVAWGALGWKAAWLSEIEPFPCAVLAHHYPDVPNLGDMTTLPARIRAHEIEAPDVFCGGTPCQAFSVAGKRQSLDDARGNLSLTFCKIANEIDAARSIRGEQPAIIFWENVPGVLNTKDNAFGCFLGELAGEVCELQPAGGKWTNAGCVFGPQRTVAWRVLDAQYFGVAQRRRRVFVVASARDGFDPTKVLFEFDGLRRDTAPRRESGQVAPTIPARSTGGGGLGTDFDLDGGVITMAHGQGGAEIGFGRSPTLTCNHEAPIAAIAFPANLSGTQCASTEEVAPSRGAANPTAVAYGTTSPNSGVKYAYYSHDYAHDRITDPSGVNPALTKEAHASGNLNIAAAVAFAENSRAEIGLEGGDGSRTGAISTGGGKPGQGVPMVAVAFQPGNLSRGAGASPSTEVFPTLKSDHGRGMSDQDPHVAYAVALRGREGGATAELGDEVQNCLRASSGGGDKPHVLAPVAYATKLHNTGSNNAGKIFEERTTRLDANSPPPALLTAMQVRRLTPTECERLQGFPDKLHRHPVAQKARYRLPRRPPLQSTRQLVGGAKRALDWSAHPACACAAIPRKHGSLK